MKNKSTTRVTEPNRTKGERRKGKEEGKEKNKPILPSNATVSETELLFTVQPATHILSPSYAPGLDSLWVHITDG